jgi:aminoglycoside phosphotransferase family enzyme/gluconate kinase
VAGVRVLETHISWVLLTGAWAYKIKKPVDLGFLDFSTLELRRHFCEEELRLNRRLAPQLYDAVVEIRGTPDAPRVEGAGPVLEYAVKMREFAQDALASRVLAANRLTPHHIDQLAAIVAAFHERTAIAGTGSVFGLPDNVLTPALRNFEALQPLLATPEDRALLAALREWTEGEHEARRALFEERHAGGAVRECHGDLHLGNIVLIDGELVAFDCIEFNPELRWIDVMSEVAFLVMDLTDRRRPDFAQRFLNTYLELTGDYGGLGVLNFYLVYRAMVRAKVHCIRASQAGVPPQEHRRLLAAGRDYLNLAQRFTCERRPALIITHGVSGSGKTTATQSLVESAGALRVRSDIERKRLHGLKALEPSGSGLGTGIYVPEATLATYARLRELARAIIEAGYTALVDATFLGRSDRDAFRALARESGVPFMILDFHAPGPVLRERVARRAGIKADASEAGLAVLERQLATHEPLAADEAPAVIAIDTSGPATPDTWRPVIERLGAGITPRGRRGHCAQDRLPPGP